MQKPLSVPTLLTPSYNKHIHIQCIIIHIVSTLFTLNIFDQYMGTYTVPLLYIKAQYAQTQLTGNTQLA